MKSNLISLIVINSVFCFFSISFFESILLALIPGFNLAMFGWLYSKDEDYLLQNKNYLLMLCIINFLTFNILSGVICASMYSQLNVKNNSKANFYKKVEAPKVDPQIKKIDSLLKLGVLLVFIAGFIFATTGWYSLPSIIKIFIFLLVACLFIGLSKFCEKKIKIKSTIYLYWILGMAFISLMFFTAGYGSLFGTYFSFLGAGSLLYWSFCILIISLLSLITYYNFNDKRFLYLVYSSILVSIVLGCIHFDLALEEIMILFVPIFTFLRLIRFDEKKDLYTLFKFSNLSLIGLAFLFISFFGAYSNVIAVIALSVLFIFNLYSYIFVEKESDFNLFASFSAYLLVIPTLVLVMKDDSCGWVLFTIFFETFLYLVSLVFNNKKLKKSSLISADILMVLAFFISFDGPKWLPLVVTLFSIFICLICSFMDNLEDYSFEFFIHPLKLSLLIFGFLYLLESYLGAMEVLCYWLSTSLLLFTLIYALCKNEKLINVYEKFSLISSVICLLFISSFSNVLSSLVIFISIVLLYANINWTKNRNRDFNIMVFIILLFNIFITSYAVERSILTNFGLLDSNYYLFTNIGVKTNYLFSFIITFVLFILVGFIHKKDKTKLNISLYAASIPIYLLCISCTNHLSYILFSFLVYYLTFIICRITKDSDSNKQIIEYVGYGISFVLVIFNSNYLVLAYSFILIVVSLLLGYCGKNNNNLFRISIGALILLIIYQLKEFWILIPAWLYILLLGIVLIVFATYKQLKIVEKNEDKSKNHKDMENK